MATLAPDGTSRAMASASVISFVTLLDMVAVCFCQRG